MAISSVFIGLTLALGLFEVISDCDLWFGLRQGLKTQTRAGAVVIPEDSSVMCELQGSTHPPVFTMEGDYMIGGVFSIHSSIPTVRHDYTVMPEPLRCTGRLV